MKYNVIERKIAMTLDRFPTVRPLAKKAYQRLCYMLYHCKGLSMELHPSVRISGILDDDYSIHKQEAFFGYYDKSPWNFDGRYFLTHILDSKDQVNIAVYDIQQAKVKVIDKTQTFNLQQGAMLRWLTYDQYFCVFNSTENWRLGAKIVDALSGKLVRWLSMPIQAMNGSGTEALSLNYKRLDRIRPEYGYNVDVENFSASMNAREDGIWKIDLTQNQTTLLISLEELKGINPHKSMANSQHKINHILYNPSGNRFTFMHRWIGPEGKFSRLYTASSRDGGDLYCLADERMVSHYAWLDDAYLVAWARKAPSGDKYFLFRDQTDQFSIIGEGILDSYGDGHPSFSPDKRWLLTDTYPDKGRMRTLLLYNLETQELFVVGKFFAPLRYEGAFRCDLHPRWDHSGTQISIDSVHEGFRNSYIIDVSDMVKNG